MAMSHSFDRGCHMVLDAVAHIVMETNLVVVEAMVQAILVVNPMAEEAV